MLLILKVPQPDFCLGPCVHLIGQPCLKQKQGEILCFKQNRFWTSQVALHRRLGSRWARQLVEKFKMCTFSKVSGWQAERKAKHMPLIRITAWFFQTPPPKKPLFAWVTWTSEKTCYAQKGCRHSHPSIVSQPFKTRTQLFVTKHICQPILQSNRVGMGGGGGVPTVYW